MFFRKAAAVCALALVCAVQAQADWVRDAISADCSDHARDRIAAGTRGQIESAVRRAEASIEPPSSVGDLSCLDGLMKLPLDWFAPTGGLESLFSGSLDGVIGSGASARQMCSFAERKWRQLTRPLTTPQESLKRGLPPDFADSFNIAQSLGKAMARQSALTGSNSLAGAGAAPATRQRSIARPLTGGRQGENSEFDPVDDIWRALYGNGDSQ